MERWNTGGKTLEFDEATHTYIYEGLILPSITQIMKIKFKNKYKGIGTGVLKRAAQKGTALHESIEKYEKCGEESDTIEFKNYKFLKDHYGWECIDNEVPVVLFIENTPVAAGRLDIVANLNGKVMLFDIKRTATLDKEYLGYQLNLYRIAYQQCYGVKIEGLKGIHLRENRRKFVNIPINEKLPMELINIYLEEHDDYELQK